METRTFLVRVQRQHVSLQVFRARKALRAARHRTDVCALARLGRFGHASAAALLDEVRDWHGRRDAWAAAGRLWELQRRWRWRRCSDSHGRADIFLLGLRSRRVVFVLSLLRRVDGTFAPQACGYAG